MARRFVSNQDETVRMFDSNFMEFFSHIHPSTPVVFFLPVVIWMIWLSAAVNELSAITIVGLFFLGLFFWTFIEYVLHRFVFHYQPKTKWGGRLHFILHGVHHDYPQDSTRLVMTPSVSLPLAAFFYGVFWLAFGFEHVNGIFAGMAFGYMCYDIIHYATHHFKMNKGIGKWLRQYHMRHHYQDDATKYGVSVPIWDYVFGTVERKKRDNG
ncbi:MAG: sterol desaturase family protein [Ignavibacteriae bacterium]|nr:sterol desaturase family protein [Ignavibacteriota bacterium]MCB9216015.1 sterol desaturase family protein [Ignavibacteria bacterium]